MSGEEGVIVGGARRAFAELTEATARLVADFAAAEDGAAELDPDLLLVGVDPLGGITLPVRAARTESDRRLRRAPTPLERLAAAAGQAPASESAAAPPRRDTTVAAGGAARNRGEEAAAAGAAGVAPVFRLADRAAATQSPPGAGVPAAIARTPGETTEAESGASSRVPLGPSAAAPVRSPAEAGAVEGTVALIAQLTESILAATARTAAAGAAASVAAGADRGSTSELGRSAGAESAFLAETLRSLGGETAAAFGVEPEAPHSRRGAESGEVAEGAAPPPATGTPTAAGPPGTGLDAPAAPAGPGLGVVSRPGEADTDPAAVAALVNDALVEQARRHGLELG